METMTLNNSHRWLGTRNPCPVQARGSHHSILEPYIERNDDFGTAHAHLCRRYGSEITDFKEYLHDREEHDQHMRQTLFGKTFRTVPPQRVWDLRTNRVVEWYWRDGKKYLWAISYAWMDVEDRTDVWTPINGYQWPVPIPKDSNLDLIRIEMLNLGADYVWLDVLCLRQPGGPGEHLRMEEWKVNVPTNWNGRIDMLRRWRTISTDWAGH
ncbi:uncharacterized protein ARMOST_22546 [Armillaria ostoyae]|uniref:Heterokaryon incompatibility domain-containing protein n=1 Tax=Armillaria ostoyae TaxID=47428 RepID=A0A284SD89_ARMOS|nr:uncharacterized protein ARMOST_22546 [Armillaria ostoyae]